MCGVNTWPQLMETTVLDQVGVINKLTTEKKNE
jgi:hypothetical protein